MTAQQFDEATPREIQYRIDALDDAETREWRRTAQLAAWVLQSLGSNVTAKRLLGEPEVWGGE